MFNLPENFFTTFIKSQYTPLPHPVGSLTSQTIIVTGANVGLGLEAARHFVHLNAATVILACRSLSKGAQAKEDIEKETGRKGVVEVWELDLASFESVKKFCERVEGLERCDVVVENAGIAIPRYVEVEGHESTIAVNVLSTFLMALLLLPTLRKSAIKTGVTPHLCIVSSEAHFMAKFPEAKSPSIFAALADPNSKNHDQKYNISKLLEVLLVRELASRLSPPGTSSPAIILNTLTPGLCNSQLMRHANPLLAVGAKIGKVLLARSTEVGSRTLVWAALAGEESHGMYMADCKVAGPSRWVRSEEGREAQKRVWEEVVGILEGVVPGIGGIV
ncbi:short-chain dehydrogenase/reductase-like protein [Aulographum hederae CBS 113979]|uniref:Short-chain dehydrogenase/reductase-like protein n=1 Tax=Aulographum hederae CBS 113979 TaxID=1176131 RepID=A0A6G1GQ93_9PEZI|nr:short-chain dehydrogenase/reductase-like protein [Aulographum hederae CBS 113979]